MSAANSGSGFPSRSKKRRSRSTLDGKGKVSPRSHFASVLSSTPASFALLPTAEKP